MKPTVGRTVHYIPLQPEMDYNDEPQSESVLPDPQPAMITKVKLLNPNRQSAKGVGTNEAEYMVSLRVFGVHDDHRLHQVRYSGTPERGHWSWPPREV